MTTKQQNIPQLRFPEFSGEWEKKKLGEIFSISAGGDIESKNVSQVKTNDFKYPIYANAEKDKGFYGYSDIYKVEENVLTVAGRGVNIGIAHARNHKFYPIVRLLVLKPLNDENIYFFENQINRIELFKESTGVPQLTAPQISGYEVYFPSLAEQTKIANFLTAVDEKIQTLKKKHSLLEQYKKGVMQRLFEHGSNGLEDDTDVEDNQKSVKSVNPKNLRFRQDDGSDFPKWEVKKLGEVLIKNSTKNKNQKYSLVQSVSNKHGFINQDEMFEDRRVASKDTSNYYVIEKGYFAYNPSRIDVGSLAYKYDDEISVVSPLYISFKANHKFLSDEYLLNWFSSEQFIKQMNSSFEGSVRNTLSYESLIKMEISLPKFEEQTKIANFLSALDEKISKTKIQIEKTEQWKKGLLQKMFV